MKTKFSQLSVGSCFTHGKRWKKKVGEARVATISQAGRVRIRDQKGDPEVVLSSCPLRFIGIGLRKNPDTVVEVGAGRPRVFRNQRLMK